MLALLLLASCEKVIQVDLNEADPRLVVEGNITSDVGPYTVKLSQTANYFGKSEYSPVTGASVAISDNQGNKEVLTDQGDGTYLTQNLQGTPGRTYTLDIVADGQNYTATSTMAQQVVIDSTFFYYNDGSLSVFAPEGFYISYNFIDPPEENYYRFESFVGDTLGKVTAARGEFLDDLQIGGELGAETSIWFDPFNNFELGDSITVRVSSIDKDIYDYYITLAEAKASSGGGFGSIPQNPPSNISNDALGFFGAFSKDEVQIVIGF